MTQDRAISLLKTGANIFLTGEPGSGKSYTINRFVEYLHEHGIEPAITASTGIAATHIGGMTIHSWSGIGIKKILTEEDIDQLSSNERLSRRVAKTQILIIDEISMLDAQTLTAVDLACKTLRHRDEPFGGMQIVFVGDFFQLPPVSRRGEPATVFAFLSPAWIEAKPLVCYLSEQHRQEDDEFLRFLSTIRKGELDEDVHDMLTSRKVEVDDTSTLTRLYTHNIDVDLVNDRKLQSLDEEVHVFEMQSRGREGLIIPLKKGCLSPERLCLKVGAQVMFTKNSFEDGFVNGTLGEVIAFNDVGGPVVRTKKGKHIEVEPMEWSIADGSKTLATITQHPLRLAWAITVHKSQGMTLDSALMDLSQAFEYGQGYVAMSRIKSFSGLHLLGYNARALEVHPQILLADKKFRQESDTTEEVFEKVKPEEQKKMEDNFIRACGGKVEKVVHKVKKLSEKKKKGETTYDITLSYLKEGMSIEKIAEKRSVTIGTIVSHIEQLFIKSKMEKKEVENILPPHVSKKLAVILKAFKDVGGTTLTPVFEKLEKKYSFDELKLVRILLD